MRKYRLFTILTCSFVACSLITGCVERQLTIKTNPGEALVILNDEEIGFSPVTTNFNWYGDYCVRIQKEGYETPNTHCELKGPWYDGFPFDFFAQILNPNRIVDSYEWTFDLALRQEISREELIQNAREMEKQLQ